MGGENMFLAENSSLWLLCLSFCDKMTVSYGPRQATSKKEKENTSHVDYLAIKSNEPPVVAVSSHT